MKKQILFTLFMLISVATIAFSPGDDPKKTKPPTENTSVETPTSFEDMVAQDQSVYSLLVPKCYCTPWEPRWPEDPNSYWIRGCSNGLSFLWQTKDCEYCPPDQPDPCGIAPVE